MQPCDGCGAWWLNACRAGVDATYTQDRRDLMTQGNDKPESPGQLPPRRAKRKSDSAFDLWLARGLHQLFDDVAKEPIPEELLKLIEDDKNS